MTSLDRGFLTLAVGPRRYLDHAVDMALSLREHSELPVAIATDERLASLAGGRYAGVFDRVVLLPDRFRTGRALKYGCAATSPFEETVFVDADCFVLGDLGGVLEVLRTEDLAMLGEYITLEDDVLHHGFRTRALMRTFGLNTYLKTNSGIFAFRTSAALPILEECLETYVGEVRPRLRWRTVGRGWLGDEITFGIVGGRRGFGVLPPPGPMFWPEEFAHIDLASPARPLLHLLHPLPDPVLSALLAAGRGRRARAGLPEGMAHVRRKMRKVARVARRCA